MFKAPIRKRLVPFITAGHPNLDVLPEVLMTLQEAGADAIEVGIPFSDPIADGPVIQLSSQAALEQGVTPTAVLSALKSVQLDVPLVVMSYLNPALAMGLQEFARRAKESAVTSVLLTDLPSDEAEEWSSLAEQQSLKTVFLVTPTSTEDRIEKACASATGFIYVVTRLGVTGEGATQAASIQPIIQSTQRKTKVPVLCGFGITTPEDAVRFATISDGVIVGSSLVRLLGDDSKSWETRLSEVKAHVGRMREALDSLPTT